MLLWWLKSFRRHREARSAEAERQLKLSQRLRDQDRREIIDPLQHVEQRNHFSELIREALQAGYPQHGKDG